MKRIAAILLFIFTLIQAGPAVHSLYADTVSVFIADEEKGSQKTDDSEKKDKKDFTVFTSPWDNLSQKLNISFHLAENIQSPPSLEKLTPPPNFF